MVSLSRSPVARFRKRGSLNFGASRVAVVLSLGMATCLFAQSDSTREPSRSASGSPSLSAALLRTSDVFDGVELSLGEDWQPIEDVAPDERHWRMEGADVHLWRDRALSDVMGGVLVEQKIATRLLGQPALWAEGVRFAEGGPRRIRVLVHDPPRAEGQLAVVVSATPATWPARREEFERLFASLGMESNGADTTDPATGDSTGDTPPGDPGRPDDTSSANGGTLGGGVPVRPIDTPPPGNDSTPVAVARRYDHARGGFSIDLSSDWTVAPGWSIDRPDADFDTLWNARRDQAVVIARVREPVSDMARSLDQWAEARRASLTQATELRTESTRIGGADGVAIIYREPSTDLASWRLSVGYDGFRYAISVYAEQPDLDQLPSEVEQLLASLRFQPRWTQRDANVVGRELPGVVMNLPEEWRQVDDPSRFDRYGDAVAIWFKEHRGQLSRLKLFRLTPNTSPLPDTNRTFFFAMTPANGNYVWWSLGSRRLPASMIATAVFNRVDETGQRWALSFETPIDQWAEMETEFRSILGSIDLSQAERVDPFPLPRWSTAYSTLDAIPNLKGDSQYMLVNRPEGVELRDQETRERMFVPVASFANALDPALGNPLMSDSRALEKLGVPLGDTVSIFDDALRVQLFRGGVLVMESAHRAFWWSSHEARPE